MDEAVQGLSAIRGWAGELNTTAYNLADSITAAFLAIAAVFMLWAVASKSPNARMYVIVWFVVLIFAMLFILK